MSERIVLISCWKEHGGAPGMAFLKFDEESGNISHLKTLNPELSCNCTAYDEKNHILYITNELHENPDYLKGGGGLIYAFQVDAETGALHQISRVESACPCPAFISLDRTGKYLLCANHSSFNAVTKAVKGADGYWHTRVEYDDAIIGLFRLNGDGSIGPLVDVKKHDAYPVEGRGLHSHPHTAKMSPDGSLFACCDKGDSHIYFYKIDYEKEELVLASEPYHDNEGASPRYCAFHPASPWFFVNHERDMRVTAFTYGKNGELRKTNTAYAIPDELLDLPTAAIRKAIHGTPVPPPADGFWPNEQQGFAISHDGRYLYDILNGTDAVAVFEIDQVNGSIRRIQTVPVDGRWVRGCAISPDGRFIIVSALQAGGVFSFPILPDGTLGDCVSHADIKGGSYVTFF